MTHAICVISLPSHSSLLTRLFVPVLAGSETESFARDLHAAFPSRCFRTAAACDVRSGGRSWASGAGKQQQLLRWGGCREQRRDRSRMAAQATCRERVLHLVRRSLTLLVCLFRARFFMRRSHPSSSVPCCFCCRGVRLALGTSHPYFSPGVLLRLPDAWRRLALRVESPRSPSTRGNVGSQCLPPRRARGDLLTLPTQRPGAACQAPSCLVRPAPDSELLPRETRNAQRACGVDGIQAARSGSDLYCLVTVC